MVESGENKGIYFCKKNIYIWQKILENGTKQVKTGRKRTFLSWHKIVQKNTEWYKTAEKFP